MSKGGLFVAAVLVALPLSAALRERSVRALPIVTLTGVIRDTSGTPIAGAIVSSGSCTSDPNGTGTDGKYSIALPGYRPTQIAVRDFAFDPQAFVVTPIPGTTFDVTLTSPHKLVTVKTASGDTHLLEVGTAQFAYLILLSGYVRSDNANFCKPDGSPFTPSKNDISRIVGPAASVNFAPCCSIGPTLMINVEMKSGDKTAAYFNDACSGYEVDFVGRERTSGLWQYLRFVDIAEIDFP